MNALQLGNNVWGIILDQCTLRELWALSQTCKQMNEWCSDKSRWCKLIDKTEFKLKEFNLKEKVRRIERIGGHLLALTESFTLKDVCRNHVLLEKVQDFACDQKTLVVCRQPKTWFRFEQYVWPDLEKPKATSRYFASKVEQLCVHSNGLAGCLSKTQVVVWEFELLGVQRCTELDGPVAGLSFNPEGELVVREGFVQPLCRLWKGKEWSDGLITRRDPTSDLWCQFGADAVVATDKDLQLIKPGRKRPKITLLKLDDSEFIQGVKRLFGGRAFISLHDCGKVILWFDGIEIGKELQEPDPDCNWIADQLTVGTDKDGYPVITYVIDRTKVRSLRRESFGHE